MAGFVLILTRHAYCRPANRHIHLRMLTSLPASCCTDSGSQDLCPGLWIAEAAAAAIEEAKLHAAMPILLALLCSLVLQRREKIHSEDEQAAVATLQAQQESRAPTYRHCGGAICCLRAVFIAKVSRLEHLKSC